MRTLIAAFACLTSFGCAMHRGDDGTPRLDAIRPDSVMMQFGSVVEVVLHGRGFAPGAPGHNVVVFGTLAINDVPANAAGTEIRLVIPQQMATGSEAPPHPTEAGDYPVRVRTPAGETNQAIVRVFR